MSNIGTLKRLITKTVLIRGEKNYFRTESAFEPPIHFFIHPVHNNFFGVSVHSIYEAILFEKKNYFFLKYKM